MSTYAKIVNNVITNTVECDPQFAADHGLVDVSTLPTPPGQVGVPGIGWGRSANMWSPPVVSAAQQNQTVLLQRLVADLVINDAFLALTVPSAPQLTAQVQALTREVDDLVRLITLQLDTIVDT